MQKGIHTMMNKRSGKSTVVFEDPPVILSSASIVGKKEGEGPLKDLFDLIEEDAMLGMDTWEEAESTFQKKAAEKVLEKACLSKKDIQYIFSGDLLGQLIATSFGLMDLEIPLVGIYGACSTMGEALALGSMAVDGGFADKILAITSSHFASAEKQFRFPLDYGNQRPLSATWTITGSGSAILGKGDVKSKDKPVITSATIGKIVDLGIKDSMNMGASMAPAACDTIYQNLADLGRQPEDYDKIITGDLGYVGQELLIKLLGDKGFDIKKQHTDCGIEIFDRETQDTHSGGSGCGCSAVTLSAYILPKLLSGEWKRVLFVPTGALLSSVSFNEGQSVPGIAHGIVLESSFK